MLETRAWLVLALLASASIARADGRMLLRDRELFRVGPAARDYCSDGGSGSDAECDRVLTKVLSGYTYARGHLSGGLTLDPSGGEDSLRGLGALHISLISADLPGGAIELAALDGVLANADTHRVRLTLVDAHGLFVCRDAQSGALVAPIIGMFTRACLPDALLAFDLGLARMQWDVVTERLLGEWLRLGPALELLGNGFGYAHLSRSIQLAVPLDVRTLHYGQLGRGTETSLGVGLRVSGFYRSPAWEARAVVRLRTTLAGRGGALHGYDAEAELRFLRNFFASDAVVMQAGVALQASASERAEDTSALWANPRQRWTTYAGLYLGWVHEAPGI